MKLGIRGRVTEAHIECGRLVLNGITITRSKSIEDGTSTEGNTDLSAKLVRRTLKLTIFWFLRKAWTSDELVVGRTMHICR